MKNLLSILLFIAGLLLHNPAVAETYTCPATADVYIDQGSPTVNFNDKTRVLVSYHTTYGFARGLWKFDIPAGITRIESASLHLSAAYNTSGGSSPSWPLLVYIYALNSAFSESTETWNTHSGGDYDTSVVSPGGLPQGNNWETTIDVTALLTGNLNKVRDYGILMKVQNETIKANQNIASKESLDPNDFAAYLEIVYTVSSSTTIEPTTSSITTSELPTTSTTSILSTTTTSEPLTTSTTTAQSTTTTSELLTTSTTSTQPTTTTSEPLTTSTTSAQSTTTTSEPLTTSTSSAQSTTTTSEPLTTSTTSTQSTTTTSTPCAQDCGAGKVCDEGICKDVTTLTAHIPDNAGYIQVLRTGGEPLTLHDGASATYPALSKITLTAVSLTSTSGTRIFSGWQGDAEGLQNPVSLVMDSNKAVTATFLQAEGSGGTITELSIVDPLKLPSTATQNMAPVMPYGLVNIAMSVTQTSAAFIVKLPVAAPLYSKWYKCGEKTSGCIDFSRDVISGGNGDGAVFNTDRTIVTVYLTDNGPYDDDSATGIISDPSGLGGACFSNSDCDDGAYCNGQETCDQGNCAAGTPPCSSGTTCREDTDQCTPTTTTTTSSGSGGYSTTAPTTTIVYPSYTCDATADVYIDEESPSTNLNDKTRLLISFHPTKGRARGLWKFNIPGIINAAQIESATLHVSGSIHTGGGTALSVYCYALNSPFDENAETWDTHNGGDYDASVFSSGSLPSGNDWEAVIDVTTLAKGNLAKLRDNGMLMRSRQEGPAKEYQNIASRESTDAGDFAAHLEIVYASTGGTTTVSSGGGGGGGGENSSTTTTPAASTTSTIPVTTSTTAAPKTSSTSSSTSTVTPSSSSTTSTTTTTALCPVVRLFNSENSREVTVIRTLRNRRMAQSIDGLVLISLYYTNAEEMTGIFSADQEIANSSAKLIRELTPALELSLTHNTSMTITTEQYDGIITILRRTQDEASPGLRRTIDHVLKKLTSGEMLKVMGITIQKK